MSDPKSRSPAHKINRPDLLESALDLCDMYLNSLQPNGVGEDEPVIADAFSNTDLRLMYEALTVAGRSPQIVTADAQIDMDWSQELGVVRAMKELCSAEGIWAGEYFVRVAHDGIDGKHSLNEIAAFEKLSAAQNALVSAAGEAACQALWAKVKAGRSPAEVPPTEDTKRLDWLEAHSTYFASAIELDHDSHLTWKEPRESLRSAIDASMEG